MRTSIEMVTAIQLIFIIILSPNFLSLKTTSPVKDEEAIHASDIKMAFEFLSIALVVLLIYVLSYCWEWMSKYFYVLILMVKRKQPSDV